MFIYLKRKTSVKFTLLELLVVISIIALLVSILLPSLKNARAKVKSTVCMNNLKQIGIASIMYSQDNAGINVPTFYPNGEGSMDYKGNWTGLLEVYLSSDNTNSVFTSTDDLPSASCPERPLRFAYGHNTDNLGRVLIGHSMTYITRQAQADKPAETLAFADNTAPGGTTEEWELDWSKKKWRPFIRGGYSTGTDSIVEFRHPKYSANVLWLDGHVTNKRSTDPFNRTGDVLCEEQWWDLEKD